MVVGGGGERRLGGDGGKELNGDAAAAVGEIFDAGDLAEVLEIVRCTGEVIGERDEEAHAYTIRLILGEEVDALAGNIFGRGGFLEMGVVRIGRTDPEGLADANAAAPPTFLLPDFLHINIRTWKRGWLTGNVPKQVWWRYGDVTIKYFNMGNCGREGPDFAGMKIRRKGKNAIRENGVPGKPKSTVRSDCATEREPQDPGKKSNLGNPGWEERGCQVDGGEK